MAHDRGHDHYLLVDLRAIAVPPEVVMRGYCSAGDVVSQGNGGMVWLSTACLSAPAMAIRVVVCEDVSGRQHELLEVMFESWRQENESRIALLEVVQGQESWTGVHNRSCKPGERLRTRRMSCIYQVRTSREDLGFGHFYCSAPVRMCMQATKVAKFYTPVRS